LFAVGAINETEFLKRALTSMRKRRRLRGREIIGSSRFLALLVLETYAPFSEINRIKSPRVIVYRVNLLRKSTA